MRVEGFEWDEGNRDKNWNKHGVLLKECEEVFFNKPFKIAEDPKRSQREKRYSILGKTDQERFLSIVFTIRKEMIRVISARNQSRKERRQYEEAEKTT